MHFKKNELTVIYNRRDERSKKILAYASTFAGKVNKQELTTADVSTTLMRIALDRSGLHPKDLMNKAHPYYQDHIRGKELDLDTWMVLLKKMPDLLKSPIALHNGRIVQCCTPTNIFHLHRPLSR